MEKTNWMMMRDKTSTVTTLLIFFRLFFCNFNINKKLLTEPFYLSLTKKIFLCLNKCMKLVFICKIKLIPDKLFLQEALIPKSKQTIHSFFIYAKCFLDLFLSLSIVVLFIYYQ